MLLCGLEDQAVVEVKNVPEECAMWYLAECDTAAGAHPPSLQEGKLLIACLSIAWSNCGVG